MKKSVVVAPTIAVVGFTAAALLAASAGSFAEPLPEPRDAIILPTVVATPGPASNTPPTASTGRPGPTSAPAPNPSHAATTPSHQPTGSGQQSGTGTGTGTGKRQQGQPVSNPGPKHP